MALTKKALKTRALAPPPAAPVTSSPSTMGPLPPTDLELTQAERNSNLRTFDLPPAPSLYVPVSTPSQLGVRFHTSPSSSVQVVVATSVIPRANGINITQFTPHYPLHPHPQPPSSTPSPSISTCIPRWSSAFTNLPTATNGAILSPLSSQGHQPNHGQHYSTFSIPATSHAQGPIAIQPPTNGIPVHSESLGPAATQVYHFTASTSVSRTSLNPSQPGRSGTTPILSTVCLPSQVQSQPAPTTPDQGGTAEGRGAPKSGKGKGPAKNGTGGRKRSRAGASNGKKGGGKFNPKNGKAVSVQKAGSTNGTSAPPVKKTYVPAYIEKGEKCAVCGDEATGMHYRSLTCEGCKGFFRRTIQKKHFLKPTFKCKQTSDCPVTMTSRNSCPPCRFQHCLAAKMNIRSVMNDQRRFSLQSLIKYNRAKRRRNANAKLSEVMEKFIKALGQSFRGTASASTTLYSFWSGREASTSSTQPTGNGPAVAHALQFVMTLLGIGEIDEGDLRVLIKYRLADFFAIHISVNWNAETDELVFSDHRLGQEAALHSSDLVDYSQQGYDTLRDYYRSEYRHRATVVADTPSVKVELTQGDDGVVGEGPSVATGIPQASTSNGECLGQNRDNGHQVDQSEANRDGQEDPDDQKTESPESSQDGGSNNGISMAWERFSAMRRRFPSTNQAWAELYDRDLQLYDTTNGNPVSQDGVAIRQLYAMAKKMSAFVKEDGIVLGCLAGLRILNTGGLKDELKYESAVDTLSELLVDSLSRYLADPKLAISLPAAMDCLKSVEEFIAYHREFMTRIARWYFDPVRDDLEVAGASAVMPAPSSTPASGSPASEDRQSARMSDVSGGSVSSGGPTPPLNDETPAATEANGAVALQDASDRSLGHVSPFPKAETGKIWSSRVEHILKNSTPELMLKGASQQKPPSSSGIPTSNPESGVRFSVPQSSNACHEASVNPKVELFVVSSQDPRGVEATKLPGATSGGSSSRSGIKRKSPFNADRKAKEIKVEGTSRNLPVERDNDMRPGSSIVRNCLQSSIAPPYQVANNQLSQPSFNQYIVAALKSKVVEAPACSLTRGSEGLEHIASAEVDRDREISNSHTLPRNRDMPEENAEPLNLVVQRPVDEKPRSLREQLQIAIEQRAKVDETIRALVEKTGEEAAMTIINDQHDQRRARSSSFGGSMSAPSLPSADTRAYSPQFRREFSRTPEGVWDRMESRQQLREDYTSGYSQLPPSHYGLREHNHVPLDDSSYGTYCRPVSRVEDRSPVPVIEREIIDRSPSDRGQRSSRLYGHGTLYPAHVNTGRHYHTERVLSEEFDLPVSYTPNHGHGRHIEDSRGYVAESWQIKRNAEAQNGPQPQPRRSTVEELLKRGPTERPGFDPYSSGPEDHGIARQPAGGYRGLPREEEHEGPRRLLHGFFGDNHLILSTPGQASQDHTRLQHPSILRTRQQIARDSRGLPIITTYEELYRHPTTGLPPGNDPFRSQAPPGYSPGPSRRSDQRQAMSVQFTDQRPATPPSDFLPVAVFQRATPRPSSTASSSLGSSPSSTPVKVEQSPQSSSSVCQNGNVKGKALKKRWLMLHSNEESEPTAPATNATSAPSSSSTAPYHNARQNTEAAAPPASSRRQTRGRRSK